ncbi:MAG: hypothetical protein QM675_04305 [Protaetiibacter sp.]
MTSPTTIRNEMITWTLSGSADEIEGDSAWSVHELAPAGEGLLPHEMAASQRKCCEVVLRWEDRG